MRFRSRTDCPRFSHAGTIIQQIGFLRLQERMLDDADDLLHEALDISEAIRRIPARATVLFYIGNLR